MIGGKRSDSLPENPRLEGAAPEPISRSEPADTRIGGSEFSGEQFNIDSTTHDTKNETMEYVYATLILNETGEEINEQNLTRTLEAAGASVGESRIKALVAALEDVDIDGLASHVGIDATQNQGAWNDNPSPSITRDTAESDEPSVTDEERASPPEDSTSQEESSPNPEESQTGYSGDTSSNQSEESPTNDSAELREDEDPEDK